MNIHNILLKKRLPVLIGLLTATILALWFSLTTIEQIPKFIESAIDVPAEYIGLFSFQSREAALAIEYPLALAYCATMGLLAGFICRLILKRYNGNS
jgi:hypothetical protein